MAKNISKRFGESDIIENFNYEFKGKSSTCIFGPSGCGKTTLLNILAGIEQPDKGVIKGVDGYKISYIFQEDRLLPWFTAFENVYAVCNNREKSLYVLEKMGLVDTNDLNKKPMELSGGMRQRVNIARGFAYDGDLFIMDEPFKGIDMILKEKIAEYMGDIMKNKTCIFTTHDMDEAKMLSNKILIVSGTPLKIIDEKQSMA